MEYDFEPYRDRLDVNWYEDDRLLRRLLARYADRGGDADESQGFRAPGAALEGEMLAWGSRAAGALRELAEASARDEERPALEPYDAHGRRVDRIRLPASTEEALREVQGREGLGAVHGDPFVFYSKVYLYWQNGEAGVACSMACTDGLVRVLEALGDRPEHEEAVEKVRSSGVERVWHGAQFVTEIQGGSDVPANRVRAVPAGDAFRLHGQKWFCSNVNADYFVVTARPEGAPEGGRGVGLFLVPAYRSEDDGRRNGYTIDRLKDKLGTRELATAEVTFDGAEATPIGRLERGLPNLVRHVLVPSRFACVLSSAASLRRAVRIVTAYTEFREAFGKRIIEYPLVEETVDELRTARRRALAASFELLRLWEASRDGGGGDPAAAGGREEQSTEAVDFRILLSLCKPVLTQRATRGLHEAMMLLGGNGIEERFSPLPRLHRDAVIMETWEGPHNVLLTQALRDLGRLDVEPSAFVRRVAGPDHGRLAADLEELAGRAGDPDATVPFAAVARRTVEAMADRVLRDVEAT